MIRLLEKEVYTVQRNNINKGGALRYFLTEGNREDTFVVYEGENYYGIVTYDSVLHPKEEEDGYIIKEKYIHKSNHGGIWNEIKEKLRKFGRSRAIIPIFNEKEEMLYLAYDENVESYDGAVEKILTEWEKKLPEVFLSEIYPELRVVKIHGLNEWAYRFWKILKATNIQVECIGEEWNLLFPEVCLANREPELLMKSNVMHIYAEGTSLFTQRKLYENKVEVALQKYWYDILFSTIGQLIHDKIRKIYCEKYKKAKVKFVKVNFPYSVISKTVEEEVRRLSPIVPGLHYSSEPIWMQESLKKMVGCTRGEYEAKCKEYISNSWDRITLNDFSVEVKRYGKGTRKIYIIGPCIVRGYAVASEEETFMYCLYQELIKSEISCEVVGIVVGVEQSSCYEAILNALTIAEGDWVIDIGWVRTEEEGEDILSLRKAIEERQEDWFWNVPIHTNGVGNRNIAHIVSDYITPYLTEELSSGRKCLQIGERTLSDAEKEAVKSYLTDVKRRKRIEENKKIGAIVMNCNPMTKGHLYLIETARKQVDYLYVFVVEENKSEYSFEDRYAMVKEETALMDNVIVVPSGKFILSYQTLPLYFEKSEKQEAVLDATDDLQIFCQYIAPELGIKIRFVGTEPTDQITRQYNESMKQMLPYYGMELVEIERVKLEEQPISATKLRKYLKEGNWKQAEKLMPEKALAYVKAM